MKEEITAMIQRELEQTGASLRKAPADVAEMIAARAEHLQEIIGEEGYELAVDAETDAIALHIGLATVRTATAADQRLLGIIIGTLRIMAAAT